MKKKTSESVPVALFIACLLLFTAAAGGLAWMSQDKGLELSFLSRGVQEDEARPAAGRQPANGEAAPEAETVQEDAAAAEPEVHLDVPKEELERKAATYGENFGLVVTEGVGSVTEDKYCPDLLYRMEYPQGVVEVNSRTKKLYWFSRSDVKTAETRLTERELVKKAREYLAGLQLEEEYEHVARRVDREQNVATVIFQKVIDEEGELYSDYEAVKMTLSAQSGQLMTCKVFDLPFSQQEGQYLTQTQAVEKLREQRPELFQAGKPEAELVVSSPIQWGREDDYTSRVVWRLTTAAQQVFYMDAASGDILGTE